MTHFGKQSLIFGLTMMTSTLSYAGSANAIFDCKSASARTTLSASVPGDHAEHSVSFTIDGETIKWKNEVIQQPPYNMDKNSNVFIVGSMKEKNYHFLIAAPTKTKSDMIEVLRFSAIPESIKVQKTSGGEKGQLSAIVFGKDPRKEKDENSSPKIVLDCNYTYEI